MVVWTKERLDEIEENFVNNPNIDKVVVQTMLLECIEEMRRLYAYTLIGKRVRITGNTNAHEFKIGETVIIRDFEEFDPEDAEYGVEASSVDGRDVWFVRHTDYEVL